MLQGMKKFDVYKVFRQKTSDVCYNYRTLSIHVTDCAYPNLGQKSDEFHWTAQIYQREIDYLLGKDFK